MKFITTATLILTFFLGFSQKKITVQQAINLVTKQSMLCQRMASEKMFLYSNPEHEISKRTIVSSSIQFEYNINIFENIILNSKILEETATIKELWNDYKKPIINSNLKPTSLVLQQSDSILNSCLSIYDELMKYAKKTQTYPYNLVNNGSETSNYSFPEIYTSSNNLKFLSQKLALYYISCFYGTEKYNHLKFKSLVTEIDQNVNIIITYKNKSSKIREKTEDIETFWKNLQTNLEPVISSKSINVNTSPAALTIKRNCGDLLRSSDRLTISYKAYNDINNI